MPPLPVELWFDILHHVVYIPGQFDTKWDYSPHSNLIWDGWKSLNSSYSESLKTKLSICRVSRTWWAIGVELLYEHLIFTDDDITRFDAISKLLSTFAKHAGDQRGYGRSTKRLEVHGKAMEDDYFPPFLCLLDLCYHISIFNVFDERNFHLENQIKLTPFLQDRFRHSLRRMSFGPDVEPYYMHDHPRLPNIPLDSAQIPLAFFEYLHPSSSLATVSILSIDLFRDRTFPNPRYETHGLSLKFPALRHLTLHRMTAYYVDRQFLQSFMSILGPQLHSLHVIVDVKHCHLHPYLEVLLAPATILRSLAFSSSEKDWKLAGLAKESFKFPSITHIGFQSTVLPPPSYLEEFISGSIFPGLRCIRLLDISNDVVSTEPGCNWASLLEVCSRREIRIEDKNYQLLRI